MPWNVLDVRHFKMGYCLWKGLTLYSPKRLGGITETACDDLSI